MSPDEDVAERLRRENPEQFLILVRMHLSFLIDMSLDENDSPTDKPKSFKWGFAKKSKNPAENTYKNLNSAKSGEITLNEENISQFYQLIDVLSTDDNLSQEGVFRRTGSLSRQQILRKFLSDGGVLNAESSETSFSVHDMASVLKGMLADISEPLLLNQHYQLYSHLATVCFEDGNLIKSAESKLLGALKLLLLLLPTLSRQLAQRLIELLHRTAAKEDSNRMSPSALSTMFTPHVLCPRRLTPESLHSDSQMLAPILSFMISNADELFVIPPQLETDINAYFVRRQQRQLLSPQGEDLNDSITERTAANTVFTFVDRQMSSADAPNCAEKSVSSTTFTDTALAQLYAHIQALPESQNKKRLIKQFNRENGHGTPLQIQRAQKQKSISHSLKKHIFSKSLMNKTLKKTNLISEHGFGYQSIVESPAINQRPNDTPKKETIVPNRDEEAPVEPQNLAESNDVETDHFDVDTTPLSRKPAENIILMTSTPHVTNLIQEENYGNCSTPIYPKNHIIRRGSMSPITKSAQKMPKAMQESIMTPRSRKPIALSQNCNREQSVINHNSSISSSDGRSLSSSSSSMKNDSDFVSTDESCPSKSYCIKYTRIQDSDTSKCMNSLQYTDDLSEKKKKLLRRAYMYHSMDADRCSDNLNKSDSDIVNDKLLEISETSEGSPHSSKQNASLSDPFRQYLLCRSVLAGSPVDLSFVSDSEDYSNVNISDSKITTSLLYCLDGNTPSDASDRTNNPHKTEYDKENISPSNKRPNQTEDIIESKRLILSKYEDADCLSQDNSKCDYWSINNQGVLRETDL